MKKIKDRFIPNAMFYFVLEYMNATNCQPIFDRHWETYDLSVPQHERRPMFSLRWTTYTQFKELFDEAVRYFDSKAEDITPETEKKYGEE